MDTISHTLVNALAVDIGDGVRWREGFLRSQDCPRFIVMVYVFEFTKVGKYCKAIGENETAVKFVGVPVTLMKIVAFAISGLMVGLGAIFSLTAVGGTSQQMGVFLVEGVLLLLILFVTILASKKNAWGVRIRPYE